MSKYLTMLILILLLIIVVAVVIKVTNKDTEIKNMETNTQNTPVSSLSESDEVTTDNTEMILEPDIAQTTKEVDTDTIPTEVTEIPTVVTPVDDEPIVLPALPKTMLIAGGCFWCVEADAEKLPGVIEAVSGYAEGTNENPTYQNYNKYGHREVVEVTYDANKVTFEAVIINAIKHMDPTDGEGSFNDRGKYYAPALYYDTEQEKQIIKDTITYIDQFGPYDKPLAIEVLARPKFWPAEDYHQDYYKGTLSALKYKYYRNASGRDAFIKKYWGSDTGPTLPKP